jgi:ubiquitin-protein ligase
MSTFLQTRIDRFINKFQDISIQDYFEIKGNDSSETITFDYKVKDNMIILEIKYSKNINKIYNIGELPDVINKEIFNYYNKSYINLVIHIFFGSNYPFSPPYWLLYDIKNNINISIDLNNYYCDILLYHNCLNYKQWSPAIDIHTDILDFIQKINHFDYMLDNKNFIY